MKLSNQNNYSDVASVEFGRWLCTLTTWVLSSCFSVTAFWIIHHHIPEISYSNDSLGGGFCSSFGRPLSLSQNVFNKSYLLSFGEGWCISLSLVHKLIASHFSKGSGCHSNGESFTSITEKSPLDKPQRVH